MSYYLPSGYIDMKRIIEQPYPFQFLIHGRGTGKTYGALKYVLDTHQKFIYLRRTQTEADLCGSQEFSPFRALMMDDENLHIVSQKIEHVKNVNGFYLAELDEETATYKPTGHAIGYSMALTTVSNIRGFSMEDCTIVIFDEFIPEKQARAIRGEDSALLNAYETISRNRELKGKPPLKLLCLSNANKISAPIFATLGIMPKINRMVMRDTEECIIADRGIAIYKLLDSPISAAKKRTSLYAATEGTEFSRMAVDNAFDSSTFLYISQQPIKEYKPIFAFEDVCVYQHKSAKGRYYVSRHTSGSPPVYYNEPQMVKRLRKKHVLFFDAWVKGNVLFEDYYCKYLLTTVCK